MEKYICNSCGYSKEFKDATEVTNNCPVCKHGIFVNEKIVKEHEAMQDMIDDNKDDDLSPQQDATEDKIEQEDVIKLALWQEAVATMKHNIEGLGHDKTWHYIEQDGNYKLRCYERMAFISAGGKIPEGEGIKI